MPQKKPWDRRDFLTRGAVFAAALSSAPAAAQKNDGDPGEPNRNTQPAPNRREIIIYRDPFAYCSHSSIVRLANSLTPAEFTHPPEEIPPPLYKNMLKVLGLTQEILERVRLEIQEPSDSYEGNLAETVLP